MFYVDTNDNILVNSYYNHQGNYSSLLIKVYEKLPKNCIYDDIDDKKDFKHLHRAIKCYCDLHNKNFLQWGSDYFEIFRIKSILYRLNSPLYFGVVFYYLTEAMLDRFIISAAIEQGCEIDDETARFKIIDRKKSTISSPAERLVGLWVNRNLPDLPIRFSAVSADGYGDYCEGPVEAKYKILNEDINKSIVEIQIDFGNKNTRNDTLHIPENGLVFVSYKNCDSTISKDVVLVYNYVEDLSKSINLKEKKERLSNNYDISFFYRKNDFDIAMAICGFSILYSRCNDIQKYIQKLLCHSVALNEFVCLGKVRSLDYLFSKIIDYADFFKYDNLKVMLDFFDNEFDKNINPLITHNIYNSIINFCHYKRESDGFFDLCVRYCYESIEFSREKILETYSKRRKHEGYLRLSILYNKKGDHKKVIEICTDALKEGWDGDWEDRIARNKIIWSNAIKAQMTQFRKQRNYKKIIELCSDALKKDLPGDWEEIIAHNKEILSSKIKDRLIQLEKQGDHENAIKLCSEALDNGLLGDWEKRIWNLSNKIKAHSSPIKNIEGCEKTIEQCTAVLDDNLKDSSEELINIVKNSLPRDIKNLAIKLEKNKKYKELVELCKSALENGLEGDWEYIIWKVTGTIE